MEILLATIEKITISAIIKRADGTVEDLGIIVETNSKENEEENKGALMWLTQLK